MKRVLKRPASGARRPEALSSFQTMTRQLKKLKSKLVKEKTEKKKEKKQNENLKKELEKEQKEKDKEKEDKWEAQKKLAFLNRQFDVLVAEKVRQSLLSTEEW